MKLNSLGEVFTVADAHDFIILGFGSHLEAVRKVLRDTAREW